MQVGWVQLAKNRNAGHIRSLGALLFGVMIAWSLASSVATANPHVALVIGNSSYGNVPPLPNPANDASAVADLFKAAGFSVQLRTNVGIAGLRRAISDFADLAADADIAVVYYAGHGIEVDGTNYLIPVDAKLARDFDTDDEALSLDRVLRAIEPARRLRLVILDACRDNPFVKTMKRSVASRSIGRGLARVEPSISETLIAFSAKAGSVALDGEGANSPFTSALLRHLATPGLDIRLAFGRVRDDVIEATGRRQEPFVYGSRGGQEISLLDAPIATPPSGNPPPQIAEAAQAWADTKDTDSEAALTAFIRRYEGSYYADLARARLEELRHRAVKAEDGAPAAATGNPEARKRAAAREKERAPVEKAKAADKRHMVRSAAVQQAVGAEPAMGAMRPGQRLLVNDGSCGPGQIKEVIGGNHVAVGGNSNVVRQRRCIPR